MQKKKQVVLKPVHQGMDKTYKVIKTSNLMEPDAGDYLTEIEKERLIRERDIDVVTKI